MCDDLVCQLDIYQLQNNRIIEVCIEYKGQARSQVRSKFWTESQARSNPRQDQVLVKAILIRLDPANAGYRVFQVLFTNQITKAVWTMEINKIPSRGI